MNTARQERWPATYYAKFGKQLSAQEVADFEAHIIRECGQPDAGEVSQGVRMAHSMRAPDDRRYASADDIVRAIRLSRNQRNDSHDGHAVNMPHLELHRQNLRHFDGRTGFETVRRVVDTDTWKAELRRNITPEQRWSIICRPSHNSACREREKFCQLNSLAYEKPEAFKAPEIEVVEFADEMAGDLHP